MLLLHGDLLLLEGAAPRCIALVVVVVGVLLVHGAESTILVVGAAQRCVGVLLRKCPVQTVSVPSMSAVCM